MIKLTPEVTKDMKHREKIGKKWIEKVSEKCPGVKWLSHYALLGPYDFMDIYEAPDDKTAAKVSMISLDNGAFTSESWPAIPYKRFIELAREI